MVIGDLRERLVFIALRMLGDREAATDAAQEAILRVLAAEREGRLPDATPIGAFAHGILRHVVADLQRQAGRETREPTADRPGADPGALDRLIAEEDARRVVSAMNRLSADDRELLERCLVRGESIVAIARRVGEPEGRLRVRKFRALRRLRDLLEGNETTPTPTQE